MGQYYRNAILKKDWQNNEKPIVASLNCYNFDNGAKLMEFSWAGNWLMGAVCYLLSTERYAGYPFVCVGDYADEVMLCGKSTDLYTIAKDWCDEEYNPKYKEFEKPLHDKVDFYKKYAFNLDKMEYVRIPQYKPQRWQIHPLSLLCSRGNGEGCGDYYGRSQDIVGSWAFDRIVVADDIKEYDETMKTRSFKLIKPNFKEGCEDE